MKQLMLFFAILVQLNLIVNARRGGPPTIVAIGPLVKLTPDQSQSDTMASQLLSQRLFYYDGIRLENHYQYVKASTQYECFKLCERDTLCGAITFRPIGKDGCHFYRSGKNTTLVFDPEWVSIFKSAYPADFNKDFSGGPTISFDTKINGLKANFYGGIRLNNDYRYVYANSTWNCFEFCKADSNCDAITYDSTNNNGCHFYRKTNMKPEFDESWSTIIKSY